MRKDRDLNMTRRIVGFIMFIILFIGTIISIAASNYIQDGYSVWAKNEIEQAYAQGIIPNDLADQWTTGIKRVEFSHVAIHYLAMQFGVDEKNLLFAVLNDRGVKPFTDTNDPYVLAAWYLGIINGRGNGIFDPESIISREEAAKILYNTYLVYASEVDNTTDSALGAGYSDFNVVSDWAQNAVTLLREWDVMHGISESEFDPKGIYTREQCYTTFLRLSNNAPCGKRNGKVRELYINNTSISLNFVLRTAKYFNEPMDSDSDFVQHRNLYGFLMNNAVRLMKEHEIEIVDPSGKDWVSIYRIPETIVKKTAELLLGITDNLPEVFYTEPEFGYDSTDNMFRFSPYSPPMMSAVVERFEQTDDGSLIITISLSNIDSDKEQIHTYYFSFMKDSIFGEQYRLTRIK